MARRHSQVIIHVMLGAAAMMIVTSGCAESTRPDNGPPYQDVPSIPKPAAPGAETGAYSDTLTVILPLATNYRPVVADMYASWSGYYRCAFKALAIGVWQYKAPIPYSIPPTWTSEVLLPVAMCNNDPLIDPPPPVGLDVHPIRLLLYQDGAIADVDPGSVGPFFAWVGPSSLIQYATEYFLSYNCPSLSGRPQLRRDRFWVRRPLEGGVGNYLLLIGNVQGEITTTYTSGSSTTETETFGQTVTSSAGLDFGKLSLGVQVTISRTFSTSVTVSQESSESFTKTVFGTSGKIVQFQVWELAERYTITDSAGEPFTDPNYVLEPEEFHIHGVALALDATEFDQ